MSKSDAEDYLYHLWENGIVPSNFTVDHTEYLRAVKQVMEIGELIHSDFF